MILFVASLAVAVVVSFFCSMTESALLSLSPSQLAEMRLRHPHVAQRCKLLKEEINRPLAVILMVNTVANMSGAAIAGSQFPVIFPGVASWVGVFSIVLSLFMVQYCEILPKSIGVRFNAQVMRFATWPLAAALVVFAPLIRFSHFINKPFEFKQLADEPPNTTDEINALAAAARSSDEINMRQERIIRAAPRLSERTARQVMVSVEFISFLSTSQTIDEAINTAHVDFHTRYPLCENDDKDEVIGYVNFKELVAIARSQPNTSKLTEIVRQIGFVAPDETADDILERFAVQHIHMAIVRDADGRTLGLITLEDILEELVGDLDDEFDPLPRTFYSPSPGFWVVGGGIAMSMLAGDARLNLPRRAEPLAMWFSGQLGRTPKTGDMIRHESIELTVRKVRRGRGLEFNVRTV